MTREDHLERLERILWEGRFYPVRRMYRRVNGKVRALAEARITLRRMRGGVDRAIERVPENMRDDPGLIYERLRWRRRKGKDAFAMELLVSPPENLGQPELWWRERAILSRRSLNAGHVSDAYKLAKDHGLSPANGADYLEAEWFAGWVALRFLSDLTMASKHFQTVFKAANYPISLSRGAYWVGRAEEAQGNKKSALEWYKRALKFSTTYYGQLAANKIDGVHKISLPEIPEIEKAELKKFQSHSLVNVVTVLSHAKLTDLMRPFVRKLISESDSAGWRTLVAGLASDSGRPDLGILTAKRTMRENGMLLESGYPLIEIKLKTPIEAPFVNAIIRQESAFYTSAKSHAGAQGLMQIMPATAKRVAKRNSIRYVRSKLTTDPQYNLRLGHAYLDELLNQYNNSYVLTLAAYNAGPARVRRWIKRNGDPRDPKVDAIDWIEMIPFTETRNYVQRVMENLHVYRHRLSDTELAFSPEDELSK